MTINIVELQKVLKTLHDSARLNVAIIEQDNNQIPYVRSMTEDEHVMVACQYHGESPVGDKAIAISDISTFLSRTYLFDLEKATVEESEGASCIKSLKVKEGRKKLFHKFSSPNYVRVPKIINKGDTASQFVLTKEVQQRLNHSVSAIGASSVKISGQSGDTKLRVDIVDPDTHESYVEEIEVNQVNESFNNTWNAKKLTQIFNYAFQQDTEESMEPIITTNGQIWVPINGIEFLIMPTLDE